MRPWSACAWRPKGEPPSRQSDGAATHTVGDAGRMRSQSIETVIAGGGQAGLALSHELQSAGREHVVLERGRTVERWRSERWDSLRLLSPNWMTRLPGQHYDGPDPDGFMPRDAVVRFFERYVAGFRARVQEGVTVVSVDTREDGAYDVETDQGSW